MDEKKLLWNKKGFSLAAKVVTTCISGMQVVKSEDEKVFSGHLRHPDPILGV